MEGFAISFSNKQKTAQTTICGLNTGTVAWETEIDLRPYFQGMENCKRQGLAKSIGLSNFNTKQLQDVLDSCTIKPAVLQVHHLLFQQYSYMYERIN